VLVSHFTMRCPLQTSQTTQDVRTFYCCLHTLLWTSSVVLTQLTSFRLSCSLLMQRIPSVGRLSVTRWYYVTTAKVNVPS